MPCPRTNAVFLPLFLLGSLLVLDQQSGRSKGAREDVVVVDLGQLAESPKGKEMLGRTQVCAPGTLRSITQVRDDIERARKDLLDSVPRKTRSVTANDTSNEDETTNDTNDEEETTTTMIEQRVRQLEVEMEGLRQCGARINPETLNLRYNASCGHKGRVYGIGLFKTGTTSLIPALKGLGYSASKETSGFNSHLFGGLQMCDDLSVSQALDGWGPTIKSIEHGRVPSAARYLDTSLAAADGPWSRP
mmetsp:Transcript_23063/g.32250  ORF Transcript_23063/g.32250 Transcript_23063/m.32250 type:complete len:247 (+) Transcript_23063:464-1204(+)